MIEGRRLRHVGTTTWAERHTGFGLRGCFERLVAQYEELISPKRQDRVGAAFFVTELHLEDARVEFVDDGSDLAAAKSLFWEIFSERDDI